MTIGFSGVRFLTPSQALQVKNGLAKISRNRDRCCWHVGDAAGVDAIVRQLAPTLASELIVYEAPSRTPWELQKRSQRLVDALAIADGTLYAWVNQPCPVGLTITSWKGSGTWGTIRYAVSRDVPVELHWLTAAHPLPEWMHQTQMRLL